MVWVRIAFWLFMCAAFVGATKTLWAILCILLAGAVITYICVIIDRYRAERKDDQDEQLRLAARADKQYKAGDVYGLYPPADLGDDTPDWLT